MTSAMILATILAGLLLSVVLFQGRSAAKRMGTASSAQACLRAQARVTQLLAAVEMTSDSAVRCASASFNNPRDWNELFIRLLPAFEQRPEISCLGYTLAKTGECALLQRLPEDHVELLMYRRDNDGRLRKQLWRFEAAAWILISETPWDGFDNRQHAFFTQAAAREQSVWSESYDFQDKSGRHHGLSTCYATPIRDMDGELIGVWQAELDSHSLSQFMRSLRQEIGIFAFIIEDRPRGRQLLVAHPDQLTLTGSETQGKTVENWVKELYLADPRSMGLNCLTDTRRIEAPFPEWRLVTLTPESELASSYRREQWGMLWWVALGAVVVVLGGSLLLARRIATPVETLQHSVRRYPETNESHIEIGQAPRELHLLALSFSELLQKIAERQRALSLLNESLKEEVRIRTQREALLDAVLSNLPFDIWVVDRSGRCLLQNASARQNQGELTGQPFAQANPALASALDWQANAKRSFGGEVIQLDTELYNQEQVLHLHAVLAPVRSGRPEIESIVCVTMDVSEQRRAEEALLASQRRLRLHLENTPLAVIDWTSERNIIAWNAAAELIFGWKSGDMLGGDFTRIFPSGDQADFRHQWDELLGGRRSSRYYCHNLTRDGRLIDCEWYSTVITDQDGHVSGVCSLVLDVSERIQAEHLFRESEERFHKAFRRASTPQAIIRLSDNTLLDVNDRWCETFGLTRRHAIGRSTTDLGIWSREKGRYEALIQDINGHGEVRDLEARLVRANGEIGVFLVSVTLVKLGPDSAMLASHVDISARKEAEEQVLALNSGLEQRVRERTEELANANQRLQELDRLKSEFLATMSHELRTPLNSIIGFSAILKGGMAGKLSAEQGRQVDWIHDSAKHLLTLINDLLDVSRIEAGRMELFLEDLDVEEVAQSVAKTLQPLASAKSLLFETRAEGALPTIRSDRKRLFQILLNIAGNAVKFTERGSVTVTLLAAPEGGLLIDVQDTGIGMRAESLPRLFEAFRQVDGSARRVYEGTGLGLYLVKKLLVLLGGEIIVTSRLGEGSCFSLRLPASAPQRDPS